MGDALMIEASPEESIINDAGFWEVAGPLTELSAREITYGDTSRLIVFQAAAMKIRHPVDDPGCLICVKDSLTRLRNAYKQYNLMAKKKAESESGAKYKLLSDVFFKGARITAETFTDELAEEILSAKPHLSRFIVSTTAEAKQEKPAPAEKPKAKTPEPKPITIDVHAE